MDAKKLAELGKIMDLCRKKGIESIKINGSDIEMKLLPEAPKSNYKKKTSIKDLGPDAVDSQEFTDEQILLWSSQGMTEGLN